MSRGLKEKAGVCPDRMSCGVKGFVGEIQPVCRPLIPQAGSLVLKLELLTCTVPTSPSGSWLKCACSPVLGGLV